MVLFLQGYRLRLGGQIVLEGVLIGLLLTAAVGLLTFVSHRKLPYKRMLVITGVLLGAVLLVMVGEQVQEMQLAGWLPTTELPSLAAPPRAGQGSGSQYFPISKAWRTSRSRCPCSWVLLCRSKAQVN